MFFFHKKPHKKVWVLRKCPSFARGENHGAHEKPTVFTEAEAQVSQPALCAIVTWWWIWDIERSDWKQHDQNALANLNDRFLDYQWFVRMEWAGMSMSLIRNVLFSTWLLSFRWGLSQFHWTFFLFTWVAKRSADNSSQKLGWFGVWMFFLVGRRLNVIQFDHSCCKIRCF